MGIKIDPTTKTFTVSYSKRHPIKLQSVTLRRIGIKTKREADKVFQSLVIEVNDRIKKQIFPTWNEFLDRYFSDREQRGISLRTTYSERMCLAKYTSPAWDSRLMNSFSKIELLELKNRLSEEVSESHLQYLLKCLRGVFSSAVDHGYLVNNPTPLHKFSRKNKIMEVLTEPQIKLLLEKAKEYDSSWFPLWALALYTGMRNGELYALQWDCVNLQTKKIKVCRSWNNKDGFKSTKSGNDRLVDISPFLTPLLQELYAQRVDDFVLPRLSRWDQGDQARELRVFLQGIGLPPMRFHDLRASWATLLLSKGLEPAKVMTMGGWADMKTMLIYMRKAGIDVHDSLKILDLHTQKPGLAEVISINSR